MTILPAIDFNYVLPSTKAAWGKFLRRYGEHATAIGITDADEKLLGVIVPRAAALGIFPNHNNEDWPYTEFGIWFSQQNEGWAMKIVYMYETFQSLRADGAESGKLSFIGAASSHHEFTQLRGLLFNPQDYQSLLARQATS